MVNIIENKAKIKGKINAIDDTDNPKGYCQLVVKLQKSEDVEGYPNLAKADEGAVVTINIHSEEVSNHHIKIGTSFEATVKKVFGQKYFIDSF